MPVVDKSEGRALVATNVRRLRHAKGWSQEKLSHLAGIDRTHLARLEAQAINVSLDVFFGLAEALAEDPRELLLPQGEWDEATEASE
jgi:transcriptional regulator with XRE-family HTH domain